MDVLTLRKTRRALSTKSALFAVLLPPPVHGQSVVTVSVISAAEKFASASKFQVVDIGPGRHTGGFRYHATRIVRVFGALTELTKRGAKPGKQLYTVFERGFGIAYNLMIVGLARMLGCRIVLHHHTSKHTLSRSWRFIVLARVAGPNCLHVLLSEAMAHNLRSLYPFVNYVHVSHNACHVGIPKIMARSPVHSDRLRVGYLSNLCAEKGLNIAIEAAIKCRQRGLDVAFVFAGPAVGAEAKNALSRAKRILGDFLEIPGKVSGPAKAAFFETIDIFLFPSLYPHEAQPMVILEAMSYGLPIITTHCGYVKELVGDDGTVLDIDEGLPDRIVEQLEQYVTNGDRRRQRSVDAQSRFLQLRATAAVQLDDLMKALFVVNSDHRGPAP
jgi:glycosyltransferase involved in cell wall biosynthesis